QRLFLLAAEDVAEELHSAIAFVAHGRSSLVLAGSLHHRPTGGERVAGHRPVTVLGYRRAMKLDRRALIQAAAAALVAPAWSGSAWAGSLGDNPFTVGVAAGDPWPDGFVIWTRLATRPLELGGGMPAKTVSVNWEVAADDRFARVVASGQALARPE